MRLEEIAPGLLAEAQEKPSEAMISAKKCKSNIPDSKLGASNLASCKSRGLRSRDSKVKTNINGKRQKIGNRKMKGRKYGGPLPDYS